MTARTQGEVRVPELVAIPAGSFRMGNDRGRADERPARVVSVGAFRAGVRPVSNAEYAGFVGATGYESPPFVNEPRFAAPDLPVVGVSWFDAVAYCEWLSGVTGTCYRLPTEAEREYAARGGLEDADWPWGNAAPRLRPELQEIACDDGPHAPTSLCANGYGLKCMADNVHEWCSDWYASYGAPSETGRRRASRGGSWRHEVKFNRVSARSSLDPAFRYNDYGFRVYA
jgi:formylglycine-generating enzyme required for sulfatase activity